MKNVLKVSDFEFPEKLSFGKYEFLKSGTHQKSDWLQLAKQTYVPSEKSYINSYYSVKSLTIGFDEGKFRADLFTHNCETIGPKKYESTSVEEAMSVLKNIFISDCKKKFEKIKMVLENMTDNC